MITYRYGASLYLLESRLTRNFIRNKSFIAEIREERYSNGEKVKTKAAIKKPEETHEVTKGIIKRTKKNSPFGFFDPANPGLDVTKDNASLYKKILEDANSRMRKRFQNASKQWQNDFKTICQRIGGSKKNNLESEIQSRIVRSLKSAKVTPNSSSIPIGVGDLVLLNENSIKLYLVASCPKDISSKSYTYINHEGEVIFGSKSLVKMRFPCIIPQDLTEVIESFVKLETKYLDVAPIGISDQEFSRSSASLPKELQTEDYDQKSLEKQEGGMASSENVSDLIVAQASSQLLKNSDVNTYHVPNKARLLYSKGLADLAIKTFENLPVISTKLEILHRALQYDQTQDLLNSPRTLTTFELAKNVERLDLNALKDINDDNEFYEKIKEQSGLSNDSSTLGSSLGREFPKEDGKDFSEVNGYPLPTFLAMILSMKNQGRWWKLNRPNSSDSPSSVSILPIKHVRTISEFLAHMKNKENETELLEYLVSRISSESNVHKPEAYEDFISLLKDYISGNINYDPEVETMIAKLIRLFDQYLSGLDKGSDSVTNYAYDYSKSEAYDMLQKLSSKSKNKSIDNPFKWSYSSQLPDVVYSSSLGKEYYDIVDILHSDSKIMNTTSVSENISLDSHEGPDASSITGMDNFGPFVHDFYTEDKFASFREDFHDTPVYCIDSESAHEIDDGISIQENENDFLVSVHVANPTSFLKSSSTISQLAFSKGSTLYLPEGPEFMLPNILSDIAGLGRHGTPTRTFVVQFAINKTIVNDFISHRLQNENHQGPTEFTQKVLDQIRSSATVKLGVVRNFPSGYTYSKVDEVLNSQENIDAFKNGSLTNENVHDLFRLFYISNILKDIRVTIGKGLDIDLPRSSIKIDYSQVEARDEILRKTDSGYQLNIENEGASMSIDIFTEQNGAQDSKSQLLVSHCMIFANYASSIFAQKHKVPIIYRNQEMRLSKEVEKELSDITTECYRRGMKYSIEDTDKILTYLGSAKYNINARGHKSLGLASYSTVTSPLRRFVDMANHWAFEQFLSNKKVNTFGSHQLSYISYHLQNSELINKKVQQDSNKFWEGIFFREYCSLLSKGKVSPIKFKLLVKSNPRYGNVSVNVLGFNNLEARVEHNSTLRDKFLNGDIKIGSILDSDELHITKVDFIENELVFELAGPK